MKQLSMFESNSMTIRPLRPKQENAVMRVREAIRQGHKRIILQAPTGFGKCHGKGTEVVMYNGSLRKVEDIYPGCLLMGPDSRARIVLNVVQGYGPLYRVTPKKGEPFVCNDVHVLSLKRTKIQSRKAKVRSDCKDGDIVNIPLNEYLERSKTFKHIHKLWRVGLDFEEKNLPLNPYYLGLFLGDGSINRSVGITTMDFEIKNVILRIATEFGLKVRRVDQEGNLSSTYFLAGRGGKNPLREIFKRLALSDSVCGNKFIPHVYLTASREQRLQLLAGLIDTDGHVFSNGMAIEYSSKSLQLIEDFQFLCRSLGFGLSRCDKVIDGVTYYRVHLSGDYSVIPSRVGRKRVLKKRAQKKNVLVSGFKVEYIGDGDYYGFALGGDHLYLLKDFTVTHNTLTAAHIIAMALEKNRRPLFTCPAITLVDQTLKAFEAEGIHGIGVIQAQHERTDWTQPVQIASVQTLVRRTCPEVHLVLIDEVHENFEALNNMLDSEEWKNKIVIGLSATPWSRGMGLRYTKLIVAATMKELIVDGTLSDFRVYVPAKDLDRSQIKSDNNEDGFQTKSASMVMRSADIIGDIVKTWKEKGPGEKTFMFCVNRSHAKEQMQAFHDAGIPFGYIDAYTELPDRRREFDKMKYGEIAGVASVGCLIRGVDEDVRAIIDAQPTKSEMRHVQKNGRGFRTADGKEYLYIFDHAGNCLSLGLPTDIVHDELDKRKPGQKDEPSTNSKPTPKPRKCKKCNALIPPGKGACIQCGQRFLELSGIETEDGELVLYGGGIKAMRAKHAPDSEQRWYSELLGLAQERRYSPGWARHRFRDKFGRFPDGLHDVTAQPSRKIREFDKMQRRRVARDLNMKPENQWPRP